MATQQVDWTRLTGRTLLTRTGERFMVVKVTARGVSVRPERARRTYSLSIPRELERLLAEFAAGAFFPTPKDLTRAGARPELSAYAWGILHAVLVDRALGDAPSSPRQAPIHPADFAGRWRIIDMPNFDAAWLAQGNTPAQLELSATRYGTLYGSYRFSYSQGTVEGGLREFDGETLLLFGFDGADEMDPVSGAGWARLFHANRLAGEFLNDYGEFGAVRERVGAGEKRNRYTTMHLDQGDEA
jgi:hypothetical protein